MKIRQIGMLLGCLAWSGMAASASAQCANATCNEAADHWNFTNLIGGAWNVQVGMMGSAGAFRPVICGWSEALNKWILSGGDGNGHVYSTTQLADDTSLCGTTGNDRIRIATTNVTCWNGRNPNVIAGTLLPFSNNGHRLSISGGAGNDIIDLAFDAVPGDHALCGGFGNDNIQGGISAEYVSGGHDHDMLYGGRGSDNVRGTTGQDVLNHIAGDGTDYMRGEDDVDCLNAPTNSQVDSASSCGTGSDYYRGLQMSSCENFTASCCAVTAAC